MKIDRTSVPVVVLGADTVWRGTFSQFLNENQTRLSLQEIDEICAALEAGKNWTWGGGALPVFTLKLAYGAISVDSLCELSEQLSDEEWNRISVEPAFLYAMDISTEAMAKIASKFTGRTISAAVNENQKQEDL